MSLATAVSLNIEAPGRRHFSRLSDYKDYDRDIITPLKFMGRETAKGAEYSKIKCTTQFIVGASDETDSEIVRYMDRIYRGLRFERVYFSAYQAGLGKSDLPGEQRFSLESSERLTREHRLYQADFLMRSYHFSLDDILYDSSGNLDLTMDPKEVWAVRHPEFYPVRLNRAEREELLRVPGLGPVSVNKILKLRGLSRIPDLESLGIKGKTAAKANRYLDFS